MGCILTTGLDCLSVYGLVIFNLFDFLFKLFLIFLNLNQKAQHHINLLALSHGC